LWQDWEEMLSTEELDAILTKDKLKLEDLLLLEHHLLYIAKIEQEYVDLPEDVVSNLNRDVDLILERLKRQRLQIQKTHLRLLTNDNQ
jgi:hypothetical protein